MNIERCRAEEVADEFGISLDTLNQLATGGQIPSRKVGGRWHFRKADVQEYFDQHQLAEKTGQSAAVLPDLLRQVALRNGSGGVVAGGVHASYADLDRASSLLADSLLSRGVVPGDRVLILLSSGLEAIAAAFGVWKAGGIVVAADPAISESEFQFILRDCSPEAVIAEREAAERLEGRHHTITHLRAVYVKGHTFGLPRLDGIRVESLETALANEATPVSLRFNGAGAEDMATITYTPDSSGRTRGVVNSHQNWLAGADFTRRFHCLTGQDALLLAAPMHGGMALRHLASCMMTGAKIILAPDLKQPARLVKNHAPTALALGAAEVKMFPEKFAPALRHVADHLRFVEVESAPGGKKAAEPLHRLLPKTAIRHWWNLTEASGVFLKTAADGSGIEKRPDGLKLEVLDEQGREAAAGKAGYVTISGFGVMSGFWGQSEYAMRSLKTEGFRLADKASVNPRGVMTLLGRMEESWDIRGRKVAPSEIETVLRRHIRTVECAVVGVKGATSEVKLHAFVVLTAKGALLTEAELKEYCRTFLESHKVPAHFHLENSLPKTSDGQIARDLLRNAASGNLGQTQWDSPTNWETVGQHKPRTGV